MSGPDPRDHAAHDLDLLSEALDSRPGDAVHQAALAQTQACAECRAAYDAMAWARREAGRLAPAAAPQELEARLKRALDRDSARTRTRALRWSAGLAAAALVVALVAVQSRRAPDAGALVAAVAADHRAYVEGRLRLELETSDPARLEAWFAAAAPGLRTRVFDLAMMGLELRGGAIRVADGRTRAVIVYRETSSGRIVICEMLAGAPSELPEPEAVRLQEGTRFEVHARDALTLVFWPEGDVLCVLVAPGDRESLIQLALAKAIKARPVRPG